MKRGSWADDLELVRAAADDDTIHVHVLTGLGVPESTIYRRCLPDGPWTLVAPSTVRLSTGTPTRRQLARAGLVYGGAEAVLTGLDAARAHGLRRGELLEVVHVLIPATSRARSVPGIRVERTHRPLLSRTRDGLRVVPMERCVIDAVRSMSSRSDVAAILTEPVQRRMLLPETLVAELDAGPRRGTALPRAVLGAVVLGARSAAEVEFHDWWSTSLELSRWPVLLNVRLTVGDDFLGIADGYLPDVGLVLPIDSVEQHFMTPDQVAAAERQHRAYRSAGLHVYGVRPSRVRGDPAGLHRDVLDAIAVAAQLPTPLVRWAADLPRPS
ncbi:hypothetical protein [Actinomycetospora termitidis]|uniref:Transcriptional regulator, AbiEi antitoxin, Type IV TA system n=1 Tax=Actinomycetospora termitidis TaxID=3053470 RepID=A0ABT7M5P8_9PSEU|nr:hypothetical protein [Actinomycetospora sp. Odt1-22]MDL5155883.1 hypothetical protein [Actinomycetospora sp. Odt1-22]